MKDEDVAGMQKNAELFVAWIEKYAKKRRIKIITVSPSCIKPPNDKKVKYFYLDELLLKYREYRWKKINK